MKTRVETIDVRIVCDMKGCTNQGRYLTDEGPYIDGWRYILIHVYDRYNEVTERDISMHVCPTCIDKLVEESEDSVE